MATEKILVIRSSALGDVAMTLPVLYSVARRYPAVEFYLLTRPFFAKIFIDTPVNLHIITADFKKEYNGIGGMRRLLTLLKSYHFTAVADLHNVLRSWIIDTCLRMQGAKVRMVDKKRSHRNTAALRRGQQSFIERYADVFRRLGYPVAPDFVSVFGDEPRKPHGWHISRPAVGIAPFARYVNKTYPVNLMEQVVKQLTARGIPVWLFGSRGDEAVLLDKWAAKYPHCQSIAGKTDIANELAAMSQLSVMVSMDSANQHLASITGTPVVSIWGSTTPGCGFYGYRQDPDAAICLGLDCQPCTVAGSNKCVREDMACLTAIDPKDIVAKVMQYVSNDPQ